MAEVQLAVYDLTRGMARTMSQAILGQRIDGIWHTGVVVYGYEYYFGGGIQKTSWGVFAQSNQMQPVQVLSLGRTSKSMQELESFLSSIQSRYTMMTYDLINNNCNNFADTVCRFLVGAGIPSYIIDLPRIVFSTPGGAMLRPMIENMQNGIRQQNGQGLDPFGGTSTRSSAQFESQLSEAVTSLVMNTMQENASENSRPPQAELDECALISSDGGTIQSMENMIHNLKGADGEKGSALQEEEHKLLASVCTKLQNSVTTPFTIDEYLFFESIIARFPKAQSAALFILRLMLLHDRTSDYGNVTIIRELIRRLLTAPMQSSSNQSAGFSSIPAHVLALCAISNLISHEKGFEAIYKVSNASSNSEEPQLETSPTDSVLNDLIDVVLCGLSNDRAEVRQMSTALAYNLTLACTKDFSPSGPWMTNGTSPELNPHAMQLLCGCFEGLMTEKDALVRRRRLSISCRICRTFPRPCGTLLKDLGFEDVLQILSSDRDLQPQVSSQEKQMIGEMLHYCRQ